MAFPVFLREEEFHLPINKISRAQCVSAGRDRAGNGNIHTQERVLFQEEDPLEEISPGEVEDLLPAAVPPRR